MKDALIIFAKNPVYGRVKTRLAATAGKDKALNVYKKLLEYTAAITLRLDMSKFVFYADEIEANDIWNDMRSDMRNNMRSEMRNETKSDTKNNMPNEIRSDMRNNSQSDMRNDNMAGKLITKKLQRGNDLGEKMYEAFKSVLEAGYDKAVIIGTDCPELDADTIVHAFNQLDLHDVVIGPAKDGGYYLLGLKQSELSLFQNISWSTNEVFSQTVEACRLSKLSSYVLHELSDIDTEQDLIDFAKSNPWIND